MQPHTVIPYNTSAESLADAAYLCEHRAEYHAIAVLLGNRYGHAVDVVTFLYFAPRFVCR